MNHYTYKITNSLTQEFYIGVRSCEREIKDDPYMGSSSLWNRQYIRANKGNLSKEIIKPFESRIDANKAESDLIEEFILDNLCINKYIPKYYKEYMRRFVTEETKRLQSINNTKENNPFFGKTHTEETKQKLSKARKERVTKDETREKLSQSLSGNKNPFYGKVHNEESKKKISKANTGKRTGEENSFYGKHHTEETKKLLSELKTGKNNPKSKSISCKNIETGEILIYESIRQLSKVEGFTLIGITKVLKSQKSYKKKYLIEYTNNS